MDTIIRKLLPSELINIYKSIELDFAEGEYAPYDVLAKQIEKGVQKGYILQQGKTDVAYSICADSCANGYILISLLSVYKEFRGFGLGSTFLEELISSYSRNQGLIVEVERPENAGSDEERALCEMRIKFYQKAGFYLIEDIDYSIWDVPMYLMALPLRASMPTINERIGRIIYEIYLELMGKRYIHKLKVKQLANRLCKRSDFMRYEGTVYRPPSEAESLLIQATIGCPHNNCTFCGMYRNTKFRIRSVADIKEDLLMARDYHGYKVRSIFFADGNTILMKTDQLLDVLYYARDMFPYLKRMTVYGSVKFLKLKKLHEFRLLREAGLTRIHSGMESGDDEVLRSIKKGFTAAEMIEEGLKVREAGIELSEYILLGIGGRERTQEHALESARVLNAFTPDFVRLRTYVPWKGTPLYEDYQQGRFHLLSPYEALKETRLLIANLEGPFELLSDHVSNFAPINGNIPNDKPEMLETIDRLLVVPENNFRQVDSRYL